MDTKNNFSIEAFLVERNYLSQEDYDVAKKDAQPGKVIEYLLEKQKITPDLIGQAIAEHHQLPYFDLNSANIPKENMSVLEAAIAQELRIILINASKESITVTTDKPENFEKIKTELNKLFPKKEIVLNYSLTEDIDQLFKVYAPSLQQRLEDIMASGNVNFAELLIVEIVREAELLHASDIHFDPTVEKIILKLRIDGALKNVAEIPIDFYENITNRIKVLAGLKIDTNFMAQNGALRLNIDEKVTNLRVAILPMLNGQKTVLRLLGAYANELSLAKLGFSEKAIQRIQTAVSSSSGVAIVAGPTGAGKTTTLYALLRYLQKPELNIMSIENPVEYKMEDVNQLQLDSSKQNSFESALSSILKQDPNIILVGDLANINVAKLSIDAALNGSFILAGIAGYDATSVIYKMINDGLNSFLLSTTLNIVIAQRLVRKNCDSCKHSVEYTESKLAEILPDYSQFKILKSARLTAYSGKGCQKCNYTGFIGRTVIYEIVEVTPKLKKMIANEATNEELWMTATDEGSTTFFENGLEKVVLGEVALEELLRVASPQLIFETAHGKKKTKKD